MTAEKIRKTASTKLVVKTFVCTSLRYFQPQSITKTLRLIYTSDQKKVAYFKKGKFHKESEHIYCKIARRVIQFHQKFWREIRATAVNCKYFNIIAALWAQIMTKSYIYLVAGSNPTILCHDLHA